MDNKKIVEAAKIPIALGLLLLLIQLAIIVVDNELLSINNKVLDIIVIVILAGNNLPLLLIILWAGFRAADKYSFGILDSGIVAAFSFFVIELVNEILNLIELFVLPQYLPSIFHPDAALASSLGSMMASSLVFAAGIGLAALIILLAIGTIFNLLVGMVGAFIATKLKKPAQVKKGNQISKGGKSDESA